MLYDTIGHGYQRRRIPDRRIGSAIHSALGPEGTVVNVGAGTGSYEPAGRCVAAIEPSLTMIRQRPPTAAPAIQALASHLPLREGCADVVTAILTLHHWTDRTRALCELGRVARRRVVFLTWDPAGPEFWLTEDYFPEIRARDRIAFPELSELRRVYGKITSEPVLIPHDCTDGFTGAYWRRPSAYLDPAVRAGMSTFSKIGAVESGLERLKHDLTSGEWARRYGELLQRDAVDLGYRLVTADL
jgi:SAM-dependent methyltransferase